MTEAPRERPELWDWLDDEARSAFEAGQDLTEAQLDAAADRRRAEETPGDNVRHLPVRPDSPVDAGLLAIRPGQTNWTAEQLGALLVHCGLEDVPQGEAWAFLHLCQRTGLDPWAREIHLIGRQETLSGGRKRMKYTAQTGIDGFRHLAERTGEYRGKEGPWWCGPDGQWSDVWLLPEPPTAARVTVLRDGLAPVTATALYREFVPMKKVWEGSGDARRPKRNPDRSAVEEPMGLWPKMPAHMLAKCAEALAIRQAFPRQAAGVYVSEEMDQADARAAEEAEEQARLERAQQRRELVSLSGPGAPASLADTATGQVVQGEVEDETLDREALLAELTEQARLLATTVPAMTRRWVLANKKNLEDATDAEIAEIVRSRRADAARLATENVADNLAADPETTPQEPQDGPVSDEPAPPGPESPDDEAAREARREAVEAQARQVAAKQRRDRDRAARKQQQAGQGTLEDQS